MVNLAFDDDMQSAFEAFKKFADRTGSKFEINVNTINARDISNLTQGNHSNKPVSEKHRQEQVDNEKTVVEKISEWSGDDFLLAFTVTLFNYGEYQFVLNIYDYLLNEKYKSILSSEIVKEPEKTQSEKDSTEKPGASQYLAKRNLRASDIFGRGLEQRLKSIDAKYDEQVMSISGVQKRVRIIRFNSQQHFEIMWKLWRNEYPKFLSDIKPELVFLTQSADFYTRILATRALGEIASTSISTAASEYLNGFAKSRDLQVRYNVGFTLSAIMANDKRNLSEVLGLLEKWVQSDWRSRWTAAAAISRLYKYDAVASIHILTQVTELSEKLSRDTEVIEEPHLELNPLAMVWHSASFMFLDGYVCEVLEMLHEWFSYKQRHKQALPDIARELFLDIFQSYFDIRANSLVHNPKNKRETLTETAPSKAIKHLDPKEQAQDSGKNNEAVDPVGISPNDVGEKEDTPLDEKDSKSLKSANIDAKADDATSKPSIESPNPVISSNASETEKERDLTEEKSVSDVINRIDINSANKILWEELNEEFKNKKNGTGTYTRKIIDLAVESLRRSWPNSQANPWFYPDRKPPYQRMQDIIRNWLELSQEDEFCYIQDPLYVILMECYVNLSIEMRDTKLKNKLSTWYNDTAEKELYQYTFIREVLDAMNNIPNHIVSK